MGTIVTRDNSDPSKPKLTIVVDNGDLAGLERAISRWNLKDAESLLRFSIAVLLSSKNGSLYSIDNEGKKASLSPAEHLLAESPSTADEGKKDGGNS